MTLAQALSPEDDDGDRQGELEESFRIFVQEHYPTLRTFLLRNCFDTYLAEDALQEALIVAMEKWDVISGRWKPLYWVRKIAWHKLQTLDDKQQWKKQVPLETIPHYATEPGSPLEAEDVLRLVLGQLPYRQRAVMALMREGDTDEQIAHQLGLALTTVRTYKSEVRKKYREMFNDDGGAA
jgi:RNA polymerase sigma factor (sigma-70 family)